MNEVFERSSWHEWLNNDHLFSVVKVTNLFNWLKETAALFEGGSVSECVCVSVGTKRLTHCIYVRTSKLLNSFISSFSTVS